MTRSRQRARIAKVTVEIWPRSIFSFGAANPKFTIERPNQHCFNEYCACSSVRLDHVSEMEA
jgi:hypothetical protein